jgi:hypothetical protein
LRREDLGASEPEGEVAAGGAGGERERDLSTFLVWSDSDLVF